MIRKPYILLLLFLTIPFILLECEKESILNDFHIYTIKNGTHSSTNDVRQFNKSKLQFIAIFDYTAKYETVDTINQADINKLYGFSDCSSGNHANSARFGWRWYQDELQIFAYCYANKVFAFRYMTSVILNEQNLYTISLEPDKYIFQVNQEPEVEMTRGCDGSPARFMLYPYFGGDETAPQDIIILIKEIG